MTTATLAAARTGTTTLDALAPAFEAACATDAQLWALRHAALLRGLLPPGLPLKVDIPLVSFPSLRFEGAVTGLVVAGPHGPGGAYVDVEPVAFPRGFEDETVAYHAAP